MMQRTTLTAEAEDLELFRREARRRGVSLNTVLNEIVHNAADSRRGDLTKRDLGLFDGPGNLAWESVQDEDSPARGRLRS